LRGRTEDNDIEDKDDETNHATTSAILPAVVGGRGGDILRERSGEGEGGQAELEEEGESVLKHLGCDSIFLTSKGFGLGWAINGSVSRSRLGR
jgi:hypothetical protein